jgi:DNA-binding response OmpR family regulator
VLVVDDEHPTVELLTDMLTTQGFRVLAAHDGRRGIALARTERPDLIVLDLLMPELTGFDVVRELREHRECREIPILIFSVKDLTAEERERLRGSVQAVVTKGGSGDLLRELARVQSAYGRNA